MRLEFITRVNDNDVLGKTIVKLSNHVEGYVIKQNKSFPDRPVIRVLYDYITKSPIHQFLFMKLIF